MKNAETRVVDPVTGAAKGSKLARFDLIPPEALLALAEHYGRGAQKYAARNWEAGYKWSLSFAALQRHAWAFWNREDCDAETGSCHMVAVMWHAAAMFTYWLRGVGTDDRPTTYSPHEPAPDDYYTHLKAARRWQTLEQITETYPAVSTEHDAIAEALDAKAGGTEPHRWEPSRTGSRSAFCGCWECQ